MTTNTELHAERLGALTSLGSPIALPATYTINIWVKNVNLDGTQQWSNLYQETPNPNGYKYVLDAHYGRIGAGNWTNNTTPDPARLSLAAGDPLKVANTWHLVTAVYGGTNIEYFANGVSIGTVDPTANATLATSFNVLNSPAGQAFAAEVKDLRVYSGVATAGEILASYSNSGTIAGPIPDETAPVITILDHDGQPGGENVTIIIGDATSPYVQQDGNYLEYVDPGAIALDNLDGVISNTVEVSGDVVQLQSTPEGATSAIYTIKYNASDAAGNPAIERIRTVTVVDASQLLRLRLLS